MIRKSLEGPLALCIEKTMILCSSIAPEEYDFRSSIIRINPVDPSKMAAPSPLDLYIAASIDGHCEGVDSNPILRPGKSALTIGKKN